MIDPASGVEALVKSYASERPYIEYVTALGTQFPPLDRSARYIKTESHKRFSIVVKLPTTFDFKDATSVNVTCSVYAGNCVSRGDRVRCSKIFKRQTPGTGPFTLEIDSLTACGSEGYRLCGLCFGEGEMTDAVTLTKRQNLKELERRAIVITVARGHVRVERDSPLPCVAEFVEPALRTKDIAVDHGKSHELYLRDLGGTKRPPQVQDFVKHRSLKNIEFIFYYLSPKFLGNERSRGLGRATMEPVKGPIKRPPTIKLATKPKSKPKPKPKSKPKRKRIEIKESCVDDVDDEESLPQKRIKTEAPRADDDGLTSSANPARPAPDAVPVAHASNISKKATGLAKFSAVTAPTASEKNSSRLGRNEKARKRAKLMLRLEEIQAEKHLQEVRVKQQLMELGDRDEDQ